MSDEDILPPNVHKWIGVVGLVVAPTTLVSTLCYYFGYVSTRTSMAHLGIDSDAIGFTTQDYVTKSVGVLYVALLTALVIGTVLVGFCANVRRVARAGRHLVLLRRSAMVVIGGGVVAVVRGVAGVLYPTEVPDQILWLTPVSLGTGAALLLLGFWMLRTTRISTDPQPLAAAERGLLGVGIAVLVLALFWTTNIFATKAGEVEGTNIAGNLWFKESTVILDTPDRLVLPSQLVKETPLTLKDSPQGETFRYECFRAIAVRGNRWVLMPANWRQQFGYTVLITADPAHRVTLRMIKDAPDRVGDAANVREYWPCPEVVPTATGPQVQSQLLGPSDIQRIIGAADTTVVAEYEQTQPNAPAPEWNPCAGAVDATTQPMPTESGFTARYGREVASGGSSPQRVNETVIEFDTPHRASDYISAVDNDWRGCADTQLTVHSNGSEQHIAFGEVADGNTIHRDIVVLPFTVHDGSAAECAHAVAAKSNVVGDVTACGPDAAAHAVAIVDAIRKRFAA
jgi:hypothetical protein